MPGVDGSISLAGVNHWLARWTEVARNMKSLPTLVRRLFHGPRLVALALSGWASLLQQIYERHLGLDGSAICCCIKVDSRASIPSVDAVSHEILLSRIPERGVATAWEGPTIQCPPALQWPLHIEPLHTPNLSFAKLEDPHTPGCCFLLQPLLVFWWATALARLWVGGCTRT